MGSEAGPPVNCVHCQTPLPDGSRYCGTCGADASDPGSQPRAPRTGTTDLQDQLQSALQGRYQISRLLGRGGMGAVFLATDLKLDRQVALKVLPLDIAHDASFVKRFEQEARTAAKLDHTNIMPIYAVEGIGDLHFFVMKYVAGRTLDQVLDAGPFPVDAAQQVLWEAACALGHAHQRGFVHRDIKPANMMLDEAGHVTLMDFGISKALQSASQFTATGQVIGTPHYMSPEQAKGEELDGRADQYSLAIVGYRMLSGRLPFDEDSIHTLLYKHIYEDPPPIETLRPEIPAFLATALRRALHKEPGDRFPSMEDFATAVWPEHPVTARKVRGRVSTSPVASSAAATQVTPPSQPVRVPKRRRWPAAVAGLLLLGSGGTAAYLVLGKGAAAPRQSPPAAAPETTAARPVVQAPSTPAQTERSTATPPERRPPAARERTTPTQSVQLPPATPAMGFVTIDAQPYGTVYIDRVEIGDTPVTRHELRPGRHIVEVRREGYRTTVDTVMITAGNANVLRKVLIREP
jgi:serine/threonine-protein kinase